MKPQIAQGFLLLGIVNAVPIAFDWDSSVKYTGVYQSSIEIFLGIPYGQDTGGANRFKPPRPYIPIRGTTINATAAGPACPQALGANFYLGDITSTSEDCLHLNIARPNGTSSQAKLPVMVHIHGGSFVTGSKDVTAIQPGGLILQAVANGLPVIEVNLNYRLGVFGFAKSQALIDDHSANAGLRDQRLALEWIQNNIEYFGGDCEKITVFGQSSGGLAVGMQIMAYGGEKPVPFHQAICESQALEPGITGKYTDLAMQRVIDAAGCNTTSLQSEATISCLRNLTTEQLFDAQSITYLSSGSAANIGDEWLPTVDGDFVPAAPSLLIEQRKFANVDTIIGWCQDDATLFTPPNITSADDTRTFIQDYVTAMTAESLDDLLSLYPVTDFQASPSDNKTVEFYRAARIVRDILFVCQPIYYAEAISAASNKVYLYEQNQTLLTPLEDAEGNPGLGVIHTSELAYVFGNLSHYDIPGLPYDPTASDYALRNRESRSWSAFASLGVPSTTGTAYDTLQGWTSAFQYPNQTAVYVIGGPHQGLSTIDGDMSSPEVGVQKLRERCAFLNSPKIIQELQY